MHFREYFRHFRRVAEIESLIKEIRVNDYFFVQ